MEDVDGMTSLDSTFLTQPAECPFSTFTPVAQDFPFFQRSSEISLDPLCQTVGLEELTTESLDLFPNPANESMNLDLSDFQGQVTVQIFTMDGRWIETRALNGGGLEQLDLSQLTPGQYFMRISDNARVGQAVLIKE